MLPQACIFTVENQELTLKTDFTIMAHTKNYLRAKFNFSGGWNNISRTAVFFDWGDKAYNIVLDESNTCVVPWEVIKAPAFRVAVYGGDFTITNTVDVPVKHSHYVKGSIPQTPSPDIYNQLATLVQNQKQLAQQFAEQASQDATLVRSDLQVVESKVAIALDAQTSAYQAQINAMQAAENAMESATLAANHLLNGVATHNQSQESHNDIREGMRQVEAIARGRATGYVFNTYEDMVDWLECPENTNSLILGDNLYIRDTNVKDYWWDGTQACPLEAECPDLTNYYTREQVDSSLPIYITQSEYDSLVSDGTVFPNRTYFAI